MKKPMLVLVAFCVCAVLAHGASPENLDKAITQVLDESKHLQKGTDAYEDAKDDLLNGFSAVTNNFPKPRPGNQYTPEELKSIAAEIGKVKNREVAQVLKILFPAPPPPPAPAPGGGGGPTDGGRRPPSIPDTRSPEWELHRAAEKHNYELNPHDRQARASYGKVLLNEGQSAYSSGDFAQAAQLGRQALQLDPADQGAQALYQLSAGREGSGAASAGGAPAGQSPSEEALNQARGQSGAGAITAAELAAAASRQAPATGIQQSAALTRQAASALSVGDNQSAYQMAAQATQLNPQNAQAWNYRAIAGIRLGRFGEAVSDAGQSLSLVPGNAAALQTRAWAFNKEQKYKEGLADAYASLESAPRSAEAYQNIAFALAGQGDNQGALEALRKSAELDPRFQGRYEQALQAPAKGDLLFLFNETPARAASAGAPEPPRRKNQFLRLLVLSLSGGLLLALAILHIVSASWREKVRATVRRVLKPAGGAPSGEAGAAFWTQYEVLRSLGSGGMGVVYAARDRSLDRTVAVKKMRDEIRADPQERQRFVTEARTVAALHHPNIVDIYSIVEDSEDVYLVFEYVPGRTLADFLREKGPLDFASARKIFRGVCEAVDYAHRQKVIHRDVKPSNIMLTEEGWAKVMDFGVARQAKDALTKLSLTNTIVGTPPYMAPEQEQGTVRRESDVYSLAVCFYEMLCGRLPFSGQGAGMLLNKINGRHAPISKQPAKGVPAGLDDVMAKALVPDPEKRYRTPMEFLAAVEALDAASRS